MRIATLIATCAAVSLLAAGQPPAANPKTTQTAPSKQYSREMLDKIRQSLTAQIAVREDAEGAMRAPTAEEAAALAGSSTETATAAPLKNGGVALRKDASQMSFAIAEIGEDGKAHMTHGPASKVAPATTKAGKGAGNGR